VGSWARRPLLCAAGPRREADAPRARQGAACHGGGAGLSLTAAVEGLGPRFRLVLGLSNEGRAAVGGLAVVLKYDPQAYR
jgi:hypothetical protein